MDAATSSLHHTYGLGPRSPNPKLGGEHSQGPREAPAAPSGPSRPGEQHQKPFFYIQPPQPYLPMQSLQWPVSMAMPMSYNPYYGYPSLGYGLQMMSHYQPNPYAEPPGFVLPQTHLHLMDYRRMLNPQYYQTMAYHARKFRYQQNSSHKEMTSSEVQTEPLVSVEKTTIQRPECTSTPSQVSLALAAKNAEKLLGLEETLASSSTSPSNGFVIQTEEVTIECCTTPVALQLLHAQDSAEISQRFSQDALLQTGVLQDESLHLPAEAAEREDHICPDILLVGKPNVAEKFTPLEEPRKLDSMVSGPQRMPCLSAEETKGDKGEMTTSKSFQLKVQLPFDPKYLDELRRMESSVWSAGEALGSSPEQLIKNSFLKAEYKDLANPPGMMLGKDEVQTKEIMLELEPVINVEQMANKRTSEGDSPTKERFPSDQPYKTRQSSPNMILLDNSSLKRAGEQHSLETNDPDTSFESLPAYLPSASWFSDFDHIYRCSKMPPEPQKQKRPLGNHDLDVSKRRRKLDKDSKSHPNVRKSKERYKPRGKVDHRSFSDHECCLNRNLNENFLSTFGAKKERLCSRCVAKHRISTSPASVCGDRGLKRKAVPFQQWNDGLLPTCEACKTHGPLRKGCRANLCGALYGQDTEGESSGTSSCCTGPKRWVADDSRKQKDLKRPLASKQPLNKCPAVNQPTLRENHACNLQRQAPVSERLQHCPHGNTIRELDENSAMPVSLKDGWINLDTTYSPHRWPTGRTWRDVMPNATKGFSTEGTTLHLKNHQKAPAQPQGNRTKDTRC